MLKIPNRLRLMFLTDFLKHGFCYIFTLELCLSLFGWHYTRAHLYYTILLLFDSRYIYVSGPPISDMRRTKSKFQLETFQSR